MPLALTFDVEEWFQADNLGIEPSAWPACPSRLERSIEQILQLLDNHQTRSTFFVLGWVAKRRPAMIQRICSCGHEIASHGYAHVPVQRQSRAEFRTDIRDSKHLLEDILSQPVSGYRAPNYSIDREDHWALDELVEAGYSYDSSIYPVRAPHGRYGVGGAPLVPFLVRPGLLEFPLPTFRWLGFRIPAATGAYLRFFPLALTRRAIAQNNRLGIPVVVNIHPWELDVDQPRTTTSRWHRILHYTNLHTMRGKLTRLLENYHFEPLCDLKAQWELENRSAPRSSSSSHSMRGRELSRDIYQRMAIAPEPTRARSAVP